MRHSPVVFMFSGHGSHYFQMGRELFDGNGVFRETLLRMNETARPLVQRSIVDFLFDDSKPRGIAFEDTVMSCAANLMIEHALSVLLNRDDLKPDRVLSTSMGIFAAGVCSGAVDPAEALTTVVELAHVFDTHCPRGAMLAVLGDQSLYDQSDVLERHADIAASNFTSHFVVSCLHENVGIICEYLTRKGIAHQQLAVSRAFHSRWIDDAKGPVVQLLQRLTYKSPAIPLVCCEGQGAVTALGPEVIWHALRRPVKFLQTTISLDKSGPYLYVDVGPSGTLATSLKYGLLPSSQSNALQVLTPFGTGLKNYDRLKQAVAASPSRNMPSSYDASREVPRADGATELSTALMFPGQGSQKRGMGSNLFDRVPEFFRVEKEIDALLGYSVRELCIKGPEEKLRQTRYTQPCLYVVNALHYFNQPPEGRRVGYLAGHSLGEYDALLAAGVFDFLGGLRLVKKRGEIMAEAKDGGMAAVIGLPSDRIADVLSSRHKSLDVANFNSPGQTVISGPSAEIAKAEASMIDAGAQTYVRLPVSAAFHSRYMSDAASAFDNFLIFFSFSAPTTTVISNVTAEPHLVDGSGAAIRKSLVEQIVRPVKWAQTIQYLLKEGVSDFDEIGPGVVLDRLLKQNREGQSSVQSTTQ